MIAPTALAPGVRRARHDVIVMRGKTKIRIINGLEHPNLTVRVVELLEELPLPAVPERRRGAGSGVTMISNQLARESSREGDPGAFLAARCEIGFQFWLRSAALTSAYLAWCTAEGLCPVSKFVLHRALRQQFRQSRSRRLQGKQVRTWEGVRLLEGGTARSA